MTGIADRPETQTKPGPLDRYRGWFVAAAIYNLVWGTLVVLFPDALFRLIGAPIPTYPPIWQSVGMMVLVYAPGYWWVSRNPQGHARLIVIALMGKVFGPIGFAWSAATGQLPLAFGLTILTNDLIWWPAFAFFLRDAARLSGGWRRFLSGD